MIIDRISVIARNLSPRFQQNIDFLKNDPPFKDLVMTLLNNCRRKKRAAEEEAIRAAGGEVEKVKEFILDMPVLRSFVAVEDAVDHDFEIRRDVLKMPQNETDPMRILSEKRKKRKTKIDARMQPKPDGSDVSGEEENRDDPVVTGPTKMLWPMPQRVQVTARTVCTDFFDPSAPMPECNYRLVLLDGPYGLNRFKGDQEWTLDQVMHQVMSTSCGVGQNTHVSNMLPPFVCVHSTRMPFDAPWT